MWGNGRDKKCLEWRWKSSAPMREATEKKRAVSTRDGMEQPRKVQ